jgi:hypothetical protein
MRHVLVGLLCLEKLKELYSKKIQANQKVKLNILMRFLKLKLLIMIRFNLPKRYTLNISHLYNLMIVSGHKKENINRDILEKIGELKNKKVYKKFIIGKKATDKEEIM